jgi:uncharacterized protein
MANVGASCLPLVIEPWSLVISPAIYPMKCPTCGKLVDPAAPAVPFCSERCQLVDLGRWLKEGYSVPVVEPPDEEDESPEGPPPDEDED